MAFAVLEQIKTTLIHFNKFVFLNSMQNKVHKLTFWS